MLWVGAKRIKQFRNQPKQLTRSCHGNTTPVLLIAQANALIYLRYRSRERCQSYASLLGKGCLKTFLLDYACA
jgi:hypothetical protein